VSHIDLDVLTRLTAAITDGVRLTPAERAETLRIAQGYACKDSAAAAAISPATIRTRRKRIYRKLRVVNATDLISTFLARSLDILARGNGLSEPAAVEPLPPPGWAGAATLR
jgi:DNA-binding CsgD family transcriptional regulator